MVLLGGVDGTNTDRPPTIEASWMLVPFMCHYDAARTFLPIRRREGRGLGFRFYTDRTISIKKRRGKPEVASEWITYAEAQKITGLSRKSLERRIRNGDVKKIPLNDVFRVFVLA